MFGVKLSDLLLGAIIVLGLIAYLLFFPSRSLPESVIIPPEENLAVAVLPLGDSTNYRNKAPSEGQDLGEKLRPYIEGEVANTKGVSVFTRSKLDEIIEEQLRGARGLIDPETAVQIGKLTGVGAIVTGEVIGFSDTIRETTITVRRGNASEEMPAVERSVEVEIQFQVIDAETGRIKISDVLRGTASKTLKESEDTPALDPLVRDTLRYLASRTASYIEGKTTKRFSYGLFKRMEPQGSWIKGIDKSTTFTRDDGQAVLLLNFQKMALGDVVKIDWVDPDGQVIDTYTYTYKNPAWDFHIMVLENAQLGNWKLEGYVNGKYVMSYYFAVQEAPKESTEN